MHRLHELLALTALASLLPGQALSQTCSVFLNEVNYDCALAAGDAGDSCEFIELGFGGTYTAGVTPVNACGIASVKLINGSSIACGVEDSIALPATAIPANGLFVIGKQGVPNVDLVPSAGSWSSTTSGAIQNGNPDWIRLVGDTAALDRWYAYEFNPTADANKNCFAKAGSVGQVAFIGEDYDKNTDLPPPVTREESVSLCGSGAAAEYLGDDEAANLTGPLATPGEPNACDSRLPWSSADAGVRDAASAEDADPAVDATSSTDAASSADATSPRDAASAPDRASSPDADSCGGLTFIGECQGTVVHWCDDGEAQSYDCADDDAVCGLVDCTASDCYGFDCVADTGETCGASEVELACDVRAGEGCRAGVCASSAVCDYDTYVEACDGPFILYCGTTRVWDEDCSLGGTEPYICGAVAGGVDCLGLVDAYCDPDYELDCAPGLTCVQNTCEGTLLIDAGVSQPDASAGADRSSVVDAAVHPDAGTTDRATTADASAPLDAASTADATSTVDGSSARDAAGPGDATLAVDAYRPRVDAGFTEVEPGMGCGCASAAGSHPAPLLLCALALCALLRRRRQGSARG